MQVAIDADTRLVIATGDPQPGNRNDCRVYRDSGIATRTGKGSGATGRPDRHVVVEYRREESHSPGSMQELCMSGVPRRNERRFYRYPMRRMAAVIADEPHLDAALSNLRRAGVDPAGINVLSGPEGARLLDRSGTGHGPFARVLRWFQGGAYEADALQIHEQALKDGNHIIYVPARGEDQRRKVADILHAAGGRYLLYFGPWHIEQLPPRR